LIYSDTIEKIEKRRKTIYPFKKLSLLVNLSLVTLFVLFVFPYHCIMPYGEQKVFIILTKTVYKNS